MKRRHDKQKSTRRICSRLSTLLGVRRVKIEHASFAQHATLRSRVDFAMQVCPPRTCKQRRQLRRIISLLDELLSRGFDAERQRQLDEAMKHQHDVAVQRQLDRVVAQVH